MPDHLPDAEAMGDARLNFDTVGEDCEPEFLVNSGIDLLAACDALADALRGAHEAIVILKRERRPDSTAPNPVWLSAIEDEARSLLARLGYGGSDD